MNMKCDHDGGAGGRRQWYKVGWCLGTSLYLPHNLNSWWESQSMYIRCNYIFASSMPKWKLIKWKAQNP